MTRITYSFKLRHPKLHAFFEEFYPLFLVFSVYVCINLLLRRSFTPYTWCLVFVFALIFYLI